MKHKMILVKDVMKRNFDIVDGKQTVSEALKKMDHTETRTLIVDKRDENDEYGIVLLADVARKVLAQDRSPERVNIYEIMSKPVFAVPPDMDIRYCARLFEQFHLHRAPVMECGELLGIVSYNDMVLHELNS